MGVDIQDLNFSVNLGNWNTMILVVFSFIFKVFLKTAGNTSNRVEELAEVGKAPSTSPSFSHKKV